MIYFTIEGCCVISVSSLPCAELSEKAGKTKQIAGREEGGGLAGCCSVRELQSQQSSRLKRKKYQTQPSSALLTVFASLLLPLFINS